MGLEIAEAKQRPTDAAPKKKRGRKANGNGTAKRAAVKNPHRKRTQAEIIATIELATALAKAPDSFEMDRTLTCAFFGGSKPLNPATLWRGMRAGIYPKPEKTGANMRRWLLGKCRAAKARNGA